MKITMRLYCQGDLDLLYLYRYSNKSLSSIIKDVIRANLNNASYSIPTPEIHDGNTIHLPKYVQFHIDADMVDDRDIIEWISKIRKGYRNNCIKNLLRYYEKNPVLPPYLSKNKVLFTSDKKPRRKKLPEEIMSTQNKTPAQDIAFPPDNGAFSIFENMMEE